MAIHSSGQTVVNLTHIEGIILCVGEEVDEVAGGASGMGVDRIGEVGDRASEGQAAGVYGAGFTAGSLAGTMLHNHLAQVAILLFYIF